jgi:hypothetical protein
MSEADEHEVETVARERDVRLQSIINDLLREGERDHGELVRRLTEAIEGNGLAAMPEPWVDAVAAEISQGNPYIVSAHAAQVTDVPPPTTHTPSETIE